MECKREYRDMVLSIPEPDKEEFRVEGYASTFDPYVLMTVDGIDYSERITPTAFDNADLSDVVFRIDHTGPVYARSSAGTIQLNTDDHGLHNITDLSRTGRSRGIFEEIKAGNYPKMSFCFTVEEGGDEYDRDTHTRVINRIKKVYDISPVTFPANPGTELSARDYFNGVIEMEKAERLDAERKERQKQKIRILLGV